MTELYRIFDTTFRCDFPLPELPLSSKEQHLFAVNLLEPEQFDATGFEESFIWSNARGQRVCWCARRADEYLFSFPGQATYHVSADGTIHCLLRQDASMQMLQHLLLNQVIPRYLATHGRLVLHASAVSLEDGHTVAFLGNSGYGKSTLAASFHRHGAGLISDDCIMLNPIENGVTVIGGFPGIRLHPDSLHAVFSETAGFTRYTPYSDKQQMLLQNQAGGVLPRGLDALFLLNDPNVDEAVDSVRIEPVSGSTAMMAMIHCAFSLDPADHRLIAQNFRHIGAAITKQAGLYSLSYPRDHARLSEVRAAVAGWIG